MTETREFAGDESTSDRGSLVVLVGRPNVGKSTLFNRLVGRRLAIVHDLPGMTRDALFGEAEWAGHRFRVADTGGMELDQKGGLLAAVWARALNTSAEAAVTVLVVDGREGVVPSDEDIARRLLRAGSKHLIVAVNKVDHSRLDSTVADFAGLGFETIVAISAEHGLGIDVLLDRIVEQLPAPASTQEGDGETATPSIQVAIIGRPNVGKSTLFNRLAGETRSMVSDVAGTTRDPVGLVIERFGHRLALIDTAGIRRRGRTEQGPEVLSVVMAQKAIERAGVAVLVLDATQGLTQQDVRVAGIADELGRGLVIALTKWDLVSEPETRRKELEEELRDGLKFATHAPLVTVSGKSGRGLNRLVEMIARVDGACARVVTTTELNRVLAKRFADLTLPAAGATNARILYATQRGTRPPAFIFFTTKKVDAHFSTIRFMVNRLREAFDLYGTPVRVEFRARKER